MSSSSEVESLLAFFYIRLHSLAAELAKTPFHPCEEMAVPCQSVARGSNFLSDLVEPLIEPSRSKPRCPQLQLAHEHMNYNVVLRLQAPPKLLHRAAVRHQRVQLLLGTLSVTGAH